VVTPGAGSEQEAHVADKYFENREMVEYGQHFLREARRLIGLSPLVDIALLLQLVQAVVDAMMAALATAQTQKSGTRTGRVGTSEAVADTVDVLRRFHYHLKTLPQDTVCDPEAFFAKGVAGRLDRLKPADLLSRTEYAVTGFSVPANAELPGAAEWQPAITTARDALAAAIAGKQEATSGNKDAVASVSEIRQSFLNLYNNVAKRLVWAALAEVGRLDDYRRYFLDLQVNEGGRGKYPETPAEPGDPSQPGAPAQPGAPVDEPAAV
jgi:hypothetical protein